MKRHPVMRASSLERQMACPTSEALPHVEGEGSDAATRGTAIHRYLELVPRMGKLGALKVIEDESPDYLEDCQAIELSKLPASKPEHYKAEVDLAYNWRTRAVELVPKDGERRRFDPAEWVFGRIDTHADLGPEKDEVFVGDWKTGFKFFGPAEEVKQLRFYGLAAARFYGRSSATVAIIRLDEDGHPWFNVGRLGPVQLLQVELELDEMARAVLSATPDGDLHEGEWCKWCPAWERCPAKTALLRTIQGEVLAPAKPEDFVPHTAATVVEWIDRAEKALARAKARLNDYAVRAGGIPMPDGRIYGPHPHPTPKVNAQLARDVLAKTFDEQVADAVVIQTPSFTMERMKDALRDYSKRPAGIGRTLKSLDDQARKALLESGANTPHVTYPVSLYKPKPAALPATPTTTKEVTDGEV